MNERELLRDIYVALQVIFYQLAKNGETLVAATDDLASAVTDLGNEVAAAVAAIQANQGQNNDAAIEDAVAQIRTAITTLQAAIAPSTP